MLYSIHCSSSFVMEWVWRILIGLAITALGVSMSFKTQWYMRILGRLPFAEKYMGGGGTRLFYKLFGVVVALLGLMITTDLFDNMMEWFIGGLFNR